MTQHKCETFGYTFIQPMARGQTRIFRPKKRASVASECGHLLILLFEEKHEPPGYGYGPTLRYKCSHFPG